jgi:hypothetical protein
LEIKEKDYFAEVNRLAYQAQRPLIDSFFQKLDFWPNVACPSSFTEKLLWRKLFDHNPLFGVLCDKLLARDWMAKRWPGLRVARTIWAGDKAADIPAEAFDGPVVLKTNHGAGFNIAAWRAPANREKIERQLDAWLAVPYERFEGEWGYSRVSRKIFVEEMLPNSAADPLIDYIVFCCDGQAVFYVLTIGEKTDRERIALYRADGTRDEEIERVPNYPARFLPRDYRLSPLAAEAVRAASAISCGLDFVRVDIMQAGGQLYAGEMTLYPGAGYGRVYTKLAVALALGELWDIRKSWFLTAPQPQTHAVYARALVNRLNRRAANKIRSS